MPQLAQGATAQPAAAVHTEATQASQWAALHATLGPICTSAANARAAARPVTRLSAASIVKTSCPHRHPSIDYIDLARVLNLIFFKNIDCREITYDEYSLVLEER
jgi:hypothetical protein